MRRLREILLFVLLMGGFSAFAQPLTGKAYECYQASDWACAKTWIDSAIVSEERNNSQTWQLRGVIYRKLETPQTLDFRNIAIESLVQARNLDVDNKYKDKIDELLFNTIIRYYNDAVTYLEGSSLKESEKTYHVYKEKYSKYLNPGNDFKQSDIDYYNALGSRYMGEIELLEASPKKDELIDKAIGLFTYVIELDSTNWQANFNTGIIYYNRGADLAMHADPTLFIENIEELDKLLTRSVELFKQALPYLHRAYRLDSSNVGVMEGITGCYYGLNDNDNYPKYQKILDEHQIDSLMERQAKNPNDLDILRDILRIYSQTIINEEQYLKYKAIYDKLTSE